MESCTKATDMEPSEPLGNCCSKHHPPSLPAKIRQKFPPWYSPYYHNQSRNANLPAGIFFDLRLQKLVMNPGKTSTLPGLSGGVSPLHWQCPHYFCSLFLINSLLSAILCVWKFFSNPWQDCHTGGRNWETGIDTYIALILCYQYYAI